MEIENLGGLISAAVAAKLTPDYIEKEVGARLDKLLTEAVNTALRSYSDTGKLIEKAVAEALRVDRLDLPTYGNVVAGMLKAQIQAKVAPLVAGRLAEDMDELLKLAPATIKLSKIAEDMRTDRDGYGPVITVIVEHSDYGFTHVYLDEREVYGARDKYRCDYHLSINKEGKIYNAKLRERDIKSSTHIGTSYGLDQRIRAYFACGTVIEIDEDNVVTSVGDY